MKSVVGAALVTGVLAVNIPNVTLNNGIQMPMISLGTWQYDDDTAEAAVRLALQTGFNHIDTANNYHNRWSWERPQWLRSQHLLFDDQGAFY